MFYFGTLKDNFYLYKGLFWYSSWAFKTSKMALHTCIEKRRPGLFFCVTCQRNAQVIETHYTYLVI